MIDLTKDPDRNERIIRELHHGLPSDEIFKVHRNLAVRSKKGTLYLIKSRDKVMPEESTFVELTAVQKLTSRTALPDMNVILGYSLLYQRAKKMLDKLDEGEF